MERDEILSIVLKAVRNNKSRLLGCGMDDLKRFAELVAAEEREACAKVCEETANAHGWNYDAPSMGREMAHKIRARSNG